MPDFVTKVIVATFGLVWLSGIAAGAVALWEYARIPGPTSAAPDRWPSETQARRLAGRPALVLVLHPKCPCSRATLAELREIVGHAPGEVAVSVLFVRPDGVEEGWEKTDLWRDAATLPGATVLRDDGCVEARRFGAVTSGQVVLFDGSGRRVFSGGITGSRGHAGLNIGEKAVLAFLSGDRPEVATTPVYGCPLASREAAMEGDRR
jgi:hypothetical protein